MLFFKYFYSTLVWLVSAVAGQRLGGSVRVGGRGDIARPFVFSPFLSPAFFFARSQQVLLCQLLSGYILHPLGAPARVGRRFFWGASWILAHTPAGGMVGFRGDCCTRGAPVKVRLGPPRLGGWVAGWGLGGVAEQTP